MCVYECVCVCGRGWGGRFSYNYSPVTKSSGNQYNVSPFLLYIPNVHKQIQHAQAHTLFHSLSLSPCQFKKKKKLTKHGSWFACESQDQNAKGTTSGCHQVGEDLAVEPVAVPFLQ
ncbi:unnamed protein product, partial [Arctogadus glacialis]